MKTTKITFVTLLITLFLSTSYWTSAQNSNNFEISKNLEIYSTLLKELNKNYVDDISIGDLTKTGIDAMLESLDPYTVYIPETEVEDYRFITTGQYGGIGALIHKEGDFIIISEPYEGKPAQLAGLIAGDKILDIDGNSAKGKSTDEVSAILKGQPGTPVTLTIEREGMDKPFDVTLSRENVKIDNIPYYGMVGGNVGYIKLTGFTQNAGEEVKEAFNKLRSENTLNGVILDLRGNGGGLLQEAVNITNIFIEKGELVVSTKGKLPMKNHSYKTMNPAVDTNIPLVILVDNSSASASEIVAGAIQDQDRGVILGQQTFGKGLVQNVIPIAYNSQAKITVAKYYIPSGRCIQEIDYSHKDANGESRQIPDSLITAFKTKNGRTVYDGHGIEPDVKMDAKTISNVGYALLTQYLIFDYACKFVREHKTISAPEEFKITDDIFRDFENYVKDKGLNYTTQSEKSLEVLKKTAEKEGYFENITGEYGALESEIEKNKAQDIARHAGEIKEILKLEIVSRYYYQRGKIISSLADDREIAKAVDLVNQKDSYLAILDGTLKKDNGENRN